jgi:hypothetical protein
VGTTYIHERVRFKEYTAENMGKVRKVTGDPLSLEEVSYILSELVIGCDDSVLFVSGKPLLKATHLF